ncbi:MAG: DUF1835 domain-containing protein [Gemmatimonadaceae bacterium]
MLHVTNGDSAAGTLRQSSVPGTVAVWGDALYEGAVPRDVDDVAFREARAHLHSGEHFSYEQSLAMAERWDRALASADKYDEVVLWFEHDLHDQLILLYLLDRFARRSTRPYALSLICIGEFRGIEPFYGLGQLNPDQLASLLGTRQSVTERQLALAQSTWRAFTGSNPRMIERAMTRDMTALQFLNDALKRLLEEFPDSVSGLPRTERTILELLKERGPMTFADMFPAHMQLEESPYMGDLTIWSRVEDLAGGAEALITRDPATNNHEMLKSRLAITEVGKRVLAGELDWMTLASIDRWIGGTHLVAPNVSWRWDRASERLLSNSDSETHDDVV